MVVRWCNTLGAANNLSKIVFECFPLWKQLVKQHIVMIPIYREQNRKPTCGMYSAISCLQLCRRNCRRDYWFEKGIPFRTVRKRIGYWCGWQQSDCSAPKHRGETLNQALWNAFKPFQGLLPVSLEFLIPVATGLVRLGLWYHWNQLRWADRWSVYLISRTKLCKPLLSTFY